MLQFSKSKFRNKNNDFSGNRENGIKRILNDTIQKEIVAFLNSFDGAIYIGVNDDGIYNNFNKNGQYA